ncbi:hypothetical protein KC19_1G015900 [Ceratodon purpureus]|uniref:Signal recognition particle 54 kDa protein n=1 Tax=Ceratodon purpureus TaxID=3225 RepID=A0A8T0J3L1_CERPU|nr:hypothetical protein KC19_1G015900 [Ceratodon purpureus]
MVLAEMGDRIKGALQQMRNATVVDERVFTECLNEISRALMAADVQIRMIGTMQANIRKIVNLKERAAGHNKRKIIQQAVFDELCCMLDPGKPVFVPRKGQPTVVMFVGLQGSGKTTTCAKYASYYQRKGWKPALVCADTFRAGAFDQLKQNAEKVRVPFYGSYTETDPVKVAEEGVERFKKERCDMIVVDTSGRHKQEAALFEEMRQVAEVTNPDLVVFVMDSSIGQAAFDQAQAFKQSVAVGAVVVTKMDGHAKGGGALSAVAATKSPVIFLGTGEHMDEFEAFEAKGFVSRLLGVGDLSGLMDRIQEAVPLDQQFETGKKLQEGNLTLRSWCELNQISIQTMGPVLMSKGGEKEGQAKFKRYMTMMDSMTAEELDSTNPCKLMKDSRINRIARGSGRHLHDVHEMLEAFRKFKEMVPAKMLKGLKNSKSGGMNAQHLSNALPPQMLQQIGGVSGLQRMMKEFSGRNFPGLK